METSVASAFFKREFEGEEESGFPRLSRVPDTAVRRFLHYFRGLSKDDAEALKCAIAKRAVSLFGLVAHPIPLTAAETLAVEHQRRALAQMGDWQFTSLKVLKMAAGMSRSEHPAVKRQMNGFEMPDDVLRWLDGLTTCKAAELRKLVKQAFASRFALTAENHGGGNWIYHQAGSADSFAVEIDYGGTWGQQLRYSVYLRRRRAGEPPSHLRFESLLGAGLGDWDFMAESSADQDVALLVDLVEYIVGLPQRLARAGAGGIEPGAAPNGGPATRLDNSGVTEGPPSVS
jgi:hypothetical protein